MGQSQATLRQRRVPFVIILLLLLLLGITSCRDADSAVAPAHDASGLTAQFSAGGAGSGAIPGRYIVTFQPGVADPKALGDALANANGGKVHYTFTHVLKGFALSVPEAALAGIRRNPNVSWVESDQVVTADDIQTGATWGIDRIDQRALPMDGSYTYASSGEGVTAYIFDTGIRFDHAEFEGRASPGYDAIGDGRNGLDCHGHGTHVAGTVGGKTYGVAKKVRLVAMRVLGCDGTGSYSGMIAAMDWVVRNNQGPAVANFSLGGSVSSTLNSALTNMIGAGVQTAVSAGNNGSDACLKSPASTAAAVTVGATSSSDTRSSYSNYGTCLDIFAPGDGITSASFSSTTGTTGMSGTSMATPHATGVLALLRAQQPGLSSQQLRDLLVANATQNIVANAASANAHLLHSLAGAAAPPPTTEPPTEPPPPTETATVPAAPTGVKAGLVAKTKVKLSWTDQSGNETGFRVERRVNGGTWAQLTTVAANATSYTDAATQNGSSYSYRAYAFNAAGGSAASNEASITVGSTRPNGK